MGTLFVVFAIIVGLACLVAGLRCADNMTAYRVVGAVFATLVLFSLVALFL